MHFNYVSVCFIIHILSATLYLLFEVCYEQRLSCTVDLSLAELNHSAQHSFGIRDINAARATPLVLCHKQDGGTTTAILLTGALSNLIFLFRFEKHKSPTK